MEDTSVTMATQVMDKLSVKRKQKQNKLKTIVQVVYARFEQNHLIITFWSSN